MSAKFLTFENPRNKVYSRSMQSFPDMGFEIKPFIINPSKDESTEKYYSGGS